MGQDGGTNTDQGINAYSLPREGLIGSTLWLERFPQEVLFRLKVILQDNGTRVPSPLAWQGRGKGRGVKQTAPNPLTPALPPLSGGEGYMYIMSEKYASVLRTTNRQSTSECVYWQDIINNFWITLNQSFLFQRFHEPCLAVQYFMDLVIRSSGKGNCL